MHGFWLLLTLPVAALLAWRLAGSRYQVAATWLGCATAVGLIGWMGFVAVSGTELTESLADRIWHAIGTLVTSINIPLVQMLLGCVLVSSWPLFGKRSQLKPTESEQSESGQPGLGQTAI